MKLATKFIHAGTEPDPSTGAIMTPIYQTSTYVQAAPGKHKGFEYARSQNPTRKALEQAFAVIENGQYGLAFGSGVAATDAVIKLLAPGDEVIAANPDQVANYRSGKEALIGFFVGQVIKASKGKANPKVVNERLRVKLLA